MLLKVKTLNGIVDGSITLVFRRWKRPTVKPGGQLRTAVGVLAIESVDEVDERDITVADAGEAGFESRAVLLDALSGRDGTLYRIRLHYEGRDPRLDLREQADLSATDVAELRDRLNRMDSRSKSGPWTRETLRLIAGNPATRAPDLAAQMGMETKRFKTNVRKLKELGLTESLKVGYRLSPRGESAMGFLS